jgi:hypothetical protein
MSDLRPMPESMETLRQERDRALEDAARWRQRYETEAQQRRTEAEASDATISRLRTEVQQLCQTSQATVRSVAPSFPAAPAASDSSSSNKQNIAIELAQLAQARDELALALSQEQQRHAKTRENLISALGEALQRGKS